MPKLLIATRKGLFIAKKQNGRWELGAPAFPGVPVSQMLADPRDGTLYAALNHGHYGPKLHASTDGGKSWQERACPAFPEGEKSCSRQGDEQAVVPASLKQIWTLETGEKPGELWAGGIPAGLFHSADGGKSWTLNRPLWDAPGRKEWFGGGYEEAGIHSVCVNPNNPAQLAVGVSCAGVWMSDDGGKRWAQRAHGMRNEYMPPGREYEPDGQDPHRLAQCAARPGTIWAQHHNGIFLLDPGAEKWREITTATPSCFGFAVAVHPREPDTAWFVPAKKDDSRMAVEGRLTVTRTRDGGKTFTELRTGLPQENAYDLIYRHGLAIDDSGDQLAIGSTTGGVWHSADQGDHWEQLPARLPPIYAVRFA